MLSDPAVSISIVSHGQGGIITALLDDLARPGWNGGQSFEVILTLNIGEDEAWLRREFPYPLRVVRNAAAKGFGANHNAAFALARGQYFAVVNPDIRLADFQLTELLTALALPKAGVCGPLVLGPHGALEDSARQFPTFGILLRRTLLGQRVPDYRPAAEAVPVDWLAGMFLLFPADVYRRVGGFDERYFMYLEDVEISRSLRRLGLEVLWVGSTALIHDAAHASRRSLRPLGWHLASFIRYFFGKART